MEAMAAGLPVVSTRCGDCIDLVEPGVSGYLVPVNDDVTLSAHLDLLLTNPELRPRMGQAGRYKMQREYSIEEAVRRMAQFYEESGPKKFSPVSKSMATSFIDYVFLR